MTRTSQYRVNLGEDGASLLDLLSSRAGLSRKKAKALLDSRTVLVNRRRVWMARHRLSADDIIEIQASPASSAAPSKVSILHADTEYIIVNKPPAILSTGSESMESVVRKQTGLKGLKAVHRLDRDTSGCLLFAATPQAFRQAVALFEDHRIGKTYHAVVSGRVTPLLQTLTMPLEHRTAVTRIRVLSSNEHASHLRIELQTGRTHQIRKHMAAVKHPVLGDREYAAGRELDNRGVCIERQMLHSASLEFIHPTTHRHVRGAAPLPRDIQECLRMYRLT